MIAANLNTTITSRPAGEVRALANQFIREVEADGGETASYTCVYSPLLALSQIGVGVEFDLAYQFREEVIADGGEAASINCVLSALQSLDI